MPGLDQVVGKVAVPDAVPEIEIVAGIKTKEKRSKKKICNGVGKGVIIDRGNVTGGIDCFPNN
jgi:hypothetical protein